MSTPASFVGNGSKRHLSTKSPIVPIETPERHGLYKLVLTVAQFCNLRCTYCYAEGGKYSTDTSRMTPQLARQSVNQFFRRYRPIKTLQFFGGEPTCNLPAMWAAVEELRTMVRNGILEKEPRYTIVTNLYLLPPKLLDFFRDTRMGITVSHDGPRDVHDELRPSIAGKGSCLQVERNLYRLRKTRIPFNIQCTYTRLHDKAGYTVSDLLHYFNKLGAEVISIVPVSLPRGNPLDVFHTDTFPKMVEGYREAIRTTFQAQSGNVKVRFGMVSDALEFINRDKNELKYYCRAGVTTLTVAANGDVYPCFMFINKPDFRLGSIDMGHHLAAFYRDSINGDFGCPGRQYLTTGKVAPFQPDQVLKHAVIDEVLSSVESIAKTQKDLKATPLGDFTTMTEHLLRSTPDKTRK